MQCFFSEIFALVGCHVTHGLTLTADKNDRQHCRPTLTAVQQCWPVYRWLDRRRLLLTGRESGDDDEVFTTRSLNVTAEDNRTQHLTASSD